MILFSETVFVTESQDEVFPVTRLSGEEYPPVIQDYIYFVERNEIIFAK